MINYVWLALIVIAVCFAGYKDVAQVDFAGTPDAQVLVNFEDGAPVFSSLPIDSQIYFMRPQLPETTTGKSATIAYDFAVQDQVSVPAEVAIPQTVTLPYGRGRETSVKPNTMTMRAYGDGAGHRFWAIFTDRDGEEFMTPSSTAISWSQEWREVTFDLSDMEPLERKVGVTANAPFNLKELLLVQDPAAEVVAGTIYIDDLGLEFPEQLVGSGSSASSSWMGVLTKSSANWAETSIGLAINLIGIMMLWLGLMRIAEKAGLVQVIASALKPIMTQLFPGIPPDGPAMGAILMNIAANMLGLANAATPLGLKAMEELQKVNPHKQYASNAMCMLLAVNTSSVTIITPTIIGYRAASGSMDIMMFWPVMIAATVTSTVAAVAACKIFEKLPMFRIPPDAPTGTEEEEAERTAVQ